MLELHLLVDRIQRFLAAGQAHLHAYARKSRIDLGLHFFDEVAAAVARLVDGLGQRGIAPGVQVAKGQVLQLTVGLVEPEPVRDRCVDFEGFARNALPLAARHVGKRAHIVRAIGQLDEDHAHVARHGQEHLAKRLCLIFLARVELQLVELGQPIDQFSHSNAEALDQVCLGDAAVLHGIVQQRRHERGRVELPARAQRRHSDRMGDVGFAAIAQLAQVRRVGKAVGLAHLLNACGVEIVEAVHERGQSSPQRHWPRHSWPQPPPPQARGLPQEDGVPRSCRQM